MKFINTCDKYYILLFILLPYTTHRLQFLDVSLFGPLAIYYIQGLNQLLANSLGMVSISKRAFWSVFQPAWKRAFSKENIAFRFRRTGVFAFNSSLVLDKISKKQSIKTLIILKIPITYRASRYMHRIYKFKPKDIFVLKLLRVNKHLIAERSISQYVIKGLLEALKQEKKRRKRNKRLNLLNEEDSGAQFFSLTRIQAVREYQAIKEENKLIKR